MWLTAPTIYFPMQRPRAFQVKSTVSLLEYDNYSAYYSLLCQYCGTRISHLCLRHIAVRLGTL